MDILIPLLFIVIFYLGPSLLKSYQAKEKTRPVVPERSNPEMVNPPLQTKREAIVTSAIELPSAMVIDKTNSVPPIVDEQSAWRGKMDPNMIINGVIFAEILQPPRAYRPFIKR